MTIFERKPVIILQALKYITYFTETLPFIFCLFIFKRMNTKDKKVFFLYTFVITVLILIVLYTRLISNSLEQYFFVTRVYNILEYTLLSYFFSLYIKNKIVKTILRFSPIPFVLFCIYDFAMAKEPILAFYPLIIEYLTLLIFIIYYFFEVMQENVVEPIYQKPIFWISVAFIINFSGNFFLFLYSKNSYNDEEFRRHFLIIYSTVTILKNILLCIGVMIKENKNDTNSDFHSLKSDFDFYPFKN